MEAAEEYVVMVSEEAVMMLEVEEEALVVEQEQWRGQWRARKS